MISVRNCNLGKPKAPMGRRLRDTGSASGGSGCQALVGRSGESKVESYETNLNNWNKALRNAKVHV